MMPEDNPPNGAEMFALFEKAIEGTLTKDEVQRLDARIANDPDARKSYLEYTHQHACLHWNELATHREPLSAIGDPVVQSARSSAFRWLGWFATLAASLALIAVGYYSSNRNAEESSIAIAKFTETSNCTWGPGLLPTEKGAAISQGSLSLLSGIATLRFASGAEVTMEAPVDLEIVDAMHCVLKHGTILANVPPKAQGFVVDTQTAQVVDQGTAFGVSVNRDNQMTEVSVFDGIVDVEQRSSHEQIRLTEGQRGVVDDDTFDVMESEIQSLDSDAELPFSSLDHDDEKVIAITSGDGDGKDSFVWSHQPDHVRYNSLLLVKHSAYELDYHWKAYLAFDLKTLSARKIVQSRLQLQIQRFEGRGFGSFVPDATFAVYGIVDGIDDWKGKSLTWNNAPANLPGGGAVDPDKTRLLGRFEIPQGKFDGFVSIEGSDLSEFISDKRDQIATIVIVRETIETRKGGLIHAFAGRKTPESSPPTLLIEVE